MVIPEKLQTGRGDTYFKNDRGAIFYGDPTKASAATNEQRQKLAEILNQLFALRFNQLISEENFKIASAVLDVIGTGIKENFQICSDLFVKFSKNYQNYIQYSFDPRVVIHCEQSDMFVQDRLPAIYNTLMLAYNFAVENNILQDFFSHAFLDNLSGFGCLDGAQKILVNWLEANIEKIERAQNKDIQETALTDSSIFQTFAEVINELKTKTIISGFGNLTYNQFLEKLKLEENFQDLGKERQNIKIMNAEEIFYDELKDPIKDSVLAKLISLKYKVKMEDIDRCWTIFRGE
ncbi:hypothetical protein [Candidatus Odyssella acanthamoebae]|nr:hypothetical protein [Candidatus Paracaedibacter acanthamoebae]